MLRRALLLLAVVLALVLVPAPTQANGPTCEKPNPTTGECTIEIPAPTPDPGTTPVGGTPGGGTAPKCTKLGGIAVPCSDPDLGVWSNSLGCYLQTLDPQPAPDSELWEGHYPEGAVYLCSNPDGIASPAIWLPGPPTEAISPEEAARAVVARMYLRAADIGIVPEDKPGSIGAVGAPVYMWTEPGPATFGPQVLTASAGGVSITATAKVDRIEWSMGDGTTVTCRTPGTVYEDQYGFNDSPDCGHRYTRTSAGKPNNAYPVAATSYWVVDWTGPGGSSGQITLDLVSRTNIVVGELQALVTG